MARPSGRRLDAYAEKKDGRDRWIALETRLGRIKTRHDRSNWLLNTGCWLLKHFQRIKKRSRDPKGEGSFFNALAVADDRVFLTGMANNAIFFIKPKRNKRMNMTKSILVCITLAAIAGCGYVQESGAASSKPSSSDKIALLGTPYKTMPKKAELLSESGPLALFSGETAEDTAFNESMLKNDPETPIFRNSLFLRRRMADGSHQWRLVMTTGSDWREASGMNSWSSERAKDVKMYFYVLKAKFSSDGRHLWMVCDPHTYTYLVICSYDIQDRTLRVLTDGDTIDEQPDGTILVKNKKTYLLDENGKSLGARWHDVWISPDGKIVREDESH